MHSQQSSKNVPVSITMLFICDHSRTAEQILVKFYFGKFYRNLSKCSSFVKIGKQMFYLKRYVSLCARLECDLLKYLWAKVFQTEVVERKTLILCPINFSISLMVFNGIKQRDSYFSSFCNWRSIELTLIKFYMGGFCSSALPSLCYI